MNDTELLPGGVGERAMGVQVPPRKTRPNSSESFGQRQKSIADIVFDRISSKDCPRWQETSKR